MTLEYIIGFKMKEVLTLGLFIIAVCVISLIPFSNSLMNESFVEGAKSNDDKKSTTSAPTTAAPTTAAPTTTTPTTAAPTTTTPIVTTAKPTTTTPTTTAPIATTAKPTTTTPIATTAKPTATIPVAIKTNVDFLNAVSSVLSTNPDKSSDKVLIYKIQGLISSLKSQNSAIILGEIGNPNNLTEPRLFLHYMNWFGSNCPIDSDTCSGLSC
jgi:cytoskeletal protein RodZ